MDLDSRFRPNNGNGGRIILLGDGTEVSTGDHDGEMFDNEDEDKDLDSQVNKYNQEANDKSRHHRLYRRRSPTPLKRPRLTRSLRQAQSRRARNSLSSLDLVATNNVWLEGVKFDA